jgi:hypothetical protein
MLICTVFGTGFETFSIPEGSGEAEEFGVPVVTPQQKTRAFNSASDITISSSATARYANSKLAEE